MATIEIDGKTLEAENGQMIIEVADEAGIYIPRFCYHKKLSIAANCRMCLVEVENGRKPLPACATPITDGMKVYTKSEQALHSQKAVMDFLLINHPLDCPICDQGGECELQDISMGFGEDASHYEESKRSVADDDLGPLIETEMTRCIHCTRCVRFGEEVAGLRELGGTGRGENMQIGTYVKHSMKSEVSGNIIDLCPVGALTSKPYRYKARAWELTQHEGIAPHDCLGSNIYLHVRRNELMRVVPKENEVINETWLSDRDRFSYLGVNHSARAQKPLIKRAGQWQEVDWETALKFTAEGMSRVIKQHGSEQMAAFASPSSTLEELYLFQKMMRELGVHNLDHRLQQVDFRDQALQEVMPTNSLPYHEIEDRNTILLVGCNIHREIPLAGTRVRKAFRNGGKVYAVNPVDYEYHFELTDKSIVQPDLMPTELAKILSALVDNKSELPVEIQTLLLGIEAEAAHERIAQALKEERAVIISGALTLNHPQASVMRSLLHLIETYSGAKRIQFTTGANTAGAWLTGLLPHRGAFGRTMDPAGKDIQASLDAKLKGYFLLGVDAAYDIANPYRARQSMLGAEFVAVVSAFEDDSLKDYADVILPMATFAETSGTYINVDQQWQTFKGAKSPVGEARPAWKILRVLANLLHCDAFEYVSTEEVLNEIKLKADMMQPINHRPYYPPTLATELSTNLTRIGEWPLYRCDAIVRHAEALQMCGSAESVCIRLHPTTADRLKLGETATVSQEDIEITLPLKRDERIAPDAIWVANAMPETVDLGQAFSAITIKR